MAIPKEELLSKLKELIQNSVSINSLPEDKKNEITQKMLASTPDQAEELVRILEEEAVQMEKLNREEAAKIQEVETLMQEIKTTETALQTEMRKEEEKKISQEDKGKQDQLLDELNKV